MQLKDVRPSKDNELKIFSMNVRALYKNIHHFNENAAKFGNFDVICLNETNCDPDKLPNGIDDIKIDGFYQPMVQLPTRKSLKGGGLAVYINKNLCEPEDCVVMELGNTLTL